MTDQITESSGWGALAKRYAANFMVWIDGKAADGEEPPCSGELTEKLEKYFRGVATEAAQMQSDRIKDLEAENTKLRDRVARLMKIEDRYRLTPEGHAIIGPSE